MKTLKQKGKNGGREPSRDLRGEMSKDRIISMSLILYWDLKMFCTLVEDYGNLGISSKCDSYRAFNTVLTSLTFSTFFVFIQSDISLSVCVLVVGFYHESFCSLHCYTCRCRQVTHYSFI